MYNRNEMAIIIVTVYTENYFFFVTFNNKHFRSKRNVDNKEIFAYDLNTYQLKNSKVLLISFIFTKNYANLIVVFKIIP